MSNEYIISVPPQTKKSPFFIRLAGITYEDPSYVINRRNSEIFTMEYVISGKGHIICNKKEYAAEAGDTYILPMTKNIRYYSDSLDPWRKIWFNAGGSFLNEVNRIFGLDNKVVFKDINTLSYLGRILQICNNKSLCADDMNLRCAGVFTEAMMFLYNEITKSDSVSKEAMTLKNYIDLHTEENISIEFLSKLIFRSESQTIRIFKKNFGTTPYDYLLENKISRAKTILKSTNLPIKEIAFRLGFSDEHYFSNVFLKKTGMCATEYRKSGF